MKQNAFLTIVACLLLALGFEARAEMTGGRTDFRDETIYFVITTRFYDGDQQNNTYCWDGVKNAAQQDPEWRGDFKGLIEKLDYIKALGFTAVWITPVVQNASGMDYHGYHAMDMSQVDKRYESDDCKFQDLIDAAHSKGMKVILDIVLNHTGNFGEANLCHLFDRDWTKPQSDIKQCMVPYTISQGGLLNDNYMNLPSGQQYQDRLSKMKNTDGVNHDTHNLWHHYGNFNWDEPNRWWAQIAGDCVDLNTENPETYQYLIDCYGSFIKMGVDGFRIDTGGHISRLAFNKAFIPAFKQLGEQYKNKRLNQCPFFMFAEVCARVREVTYRGQPSLSPYFYTWQSDASLLNAWNSNPAYWQGIQIFESTDPATLDNQQLCLTEHNNAGSESTQPHSNNATLDGNSYHTPDYSQNSGLSVIDFTAHWNYQSAQNVWGVFDKDYLYNDATYNVMYVDSHDYGPDADTRFNGGTSQWAENLSLMFTMRGIPCLYYGSEIEFRKGKPCDKGTDDALTNTGRAYYGGYIKGNVTTTDFGEFTGATGNVGATLSQPLATHLRRLNKIRAAVPALRKGQYSKSGCSSTSGGYSFKRRYTSGNTDSYALIALNSKATFTGVLNGTYTDCITGDVQQVTNGTLTTPNFSGKGNLRVYVLNGPGKVGDDGPYLYGSTPASVPTLAYDGTQEEGDPNTEYIVNGQGGGTIPNIDSLEVYTPTVESGELCVFYEAPASRRVVTVWAWNSTTNFTGGSWPGQNAFLMGKNQDGSRLIFKWTYNDTWTASNMPTGLIFSTAGSDQTANLVFKNHGYYIDGVWDHEVTEVVDDAPTVSVNPPAGTYVDAEAIDVTITASVNTATIVYTTDGSMPTTTSTSATGSVTLHFTTNTTLKAGVLYEGRVRNVISCEYILNPPTEHTVTVYVKDPTAAPWNWTSVYYWAWNDSGNLCDHKSWPGDEWTTTTMVKGEKFYYKMFTSAENNFSVNFIFSQNGSPQTVDLGPFTKDVYLELDTFSSKWTVKDITNEYAYQTGDVNRDGRVNVSDVTTLINMILGFLPVDQAVADVNSDGRVNVSDVTSIINIILGIV